MTLTEAMKYRGLTVWKLAERTAANSPPPIIIAVPKSAGKGEIGAKSCMTSCEA